MAKIKKISITLDYEKIMGKAAREEYLEQNPHGFKWTRKVHKNKKKYNRKGKKGRNFDSFFLHFCEKYFKL